jgi:hypothetical protein
LLIYALKVNFSGSSDEKRCFRPTDTVSRRTGLAADLYWFLLKSMNFKSKLHPCSFDLVATVKRCFAVPLEMLHISA